MPDIKPGDFIEVLRLVEGSFEKENGFVCSVKPEKGIVEFGWLVSGHFPDGKRKYAPYPDYKRNILSSNLFLHKWERRGESMLITDHAKVSKNVAVEKKKEKPGFFSFIRKIFK